MKAMYSTNGRTIGVSSTYIENNANVCIFKKAESSLMTICCFFCALILRTVERINRLVVIENMKSKSVFIASSVLSIPIGIYIITEGWRKMSDSNYTQEELNAGFIFSAIWISLGVAIFLQWFFWFGAHLISFSKKFKEEHFVFNLGVLILSTCIIITGIQILEENPLYMNVCQCDPGYYGIECTPCPGYPNICNGHGECDDLVMGFGSCGCETGYTGSNCDICSPRFQQIDDECVCEKVWTGSDCSLTVPGFDTSSYPYVFCKHGWTQTSTESSPRPNPYWSSPIFWPVCGKCSKYFSGHPDIDCKPCLGWNGEQPITDDNVCNGHGNCWDNDRYNLKVWECSGGTCEDGVEEGGLKNTCTQTEKICQTDVDCPDTYNCGGRCRSIYRWPDKPTASWDNTFNGKLCHENSDCNFANNIYIGSVLPEGWDREGECTERTCCVESKVGDSTCNGCRLNDTYINGVVVKMGGPTMGRLPPACEACPGWDNDVDVNGQTICNNKGTCLPIYDVFNEYDSMQCKCAKDVETGNTWKGDFCECLEESPYTSHCLKCVQGFFLPPDITQTLAQNKPIDAVAGCTPCPGAEQGTGVAACSWKRGLGACVYNDAIGERKTSPVNEDDTSYTARLLNVGKCSCTNKLLDVPIIAAMGNVCNEAPPNFYRAPSGSDWTMMPCPRTLPLGVDVCEDIAPQYIWNYVGSDGTSRSSCTQSCGGKPIASAICMDEMSLGQEWADSFENWSFINKTRGDQGTCECNDVDPTFRYYKGASGTCVKSK